MNRLALILFKVFYLGGIPVAIYVAATGYPKMRETSVPVSDLSGYLLALGLIHMLVLVALGGLVAKPDKPYAGTRIQTAGYLHTLIGFAAALLLLSNPDPELIDLISPLGSAVFTSIIGWFVGSEIVEKGTGHQRQQFMGEKMDGVAQEFEDFAAGISRVHKEYLTALRAAVNELKRETDTIKEAKLSTDELGRMLSSVGELSQTLVANLRGLATKSGEARTELGQVAVAAKDAAKYLSESKVLIEELEKLLDYVSNNRGARR